MKYVLAVIGLFLSMGAAAQAPGLPKPSAAVSGAYQKVAMLSKIVQDKQLSLAVSQKDYREAMDSVVDLVNKECPGCQYNPAQNVFAKPAPKE